MSIVSLSPALAEMLRSQNLPQTLLFHGEHEEALFSAAKAVAKELMGSSHAKRIEEGQHPDFHLFFPDGKSSMHSISSMQEMIQEAYMAPFEAPVKMFVIAEAHRMLPASSNSLLKTLEEPLEKVYFILLSSQPDSLIPTIVSRCCKISILGKSLEKQLHPIFGSFSKSYPDFLLDLASAGEEAFSLGEMELFFEELLKKHPEMKVFQLIEKCRKALASNVKPAVVLEHLFLETQNYKL